MYFVGPTQAKGPGVEKLTTAYRERYDMEPAVSYFLSAYDAATMLFHTIEKAATMKEDGTVIIERQKMRDALYAGKPFNGITGTLKCNKFGDCIIPSFQILRMDNPELGLKGLQENIVFSGNAQQ